MKRFVNADIIAGQLSNAITLNRYAYANGNPVSFVDPFGLKGFFASLWDKVVEIYDSAKKWVEDTIDTVTDTVNDAVNWVDENVVQPIATFVNEKIVEPTLDFVINNAPEPIANFARDIKNYDKNNTDEQKVLDSHYFSSYKGKFILRLPIGNNAFSFGIIFLGSGVAKNDYNTVKHEYGHTIQFDKMGVWNYIKNVGIPSVTAYLLDSHGKLNYDYYTAPWEADADMYGNVSRTTGSLPSWTFNDGYFDFGDLLKALFNI